MGRTNKDVVILGAGPVALGLGKILKVPVLPRAADDCGWIWPKTGLPDKCRLIFVAGSNLGPDQIVRQHAELWVAPKASRLGVVVLIPDELTAGELLSRDVFGRKEASGSTFADFSIAGAIRIVAAPVSLHSLLASISALDLFPKDSWHRQAKDASCLPLLVEAIRQRSVPELERVLPLAKDVHWDSICHPTRAFPNHHAYANAIDMWLDSVTPGVTPEWEAGFDLIEPLAKR